MYQKLYQALSKWPNQREGLTLRALMARLFPQTRIISVTTATLTVTEDLHEGRTVVLNRAAGSTLTLPTATGSGAKYRFIVGTAVTSNSNIIKVNDAATTMAGFCLMLQDGGDTVTGFEAGATADTITLNGTTTAGLKGDEIMLEDIGASQWQVSMIAAGTGTEATPFSATV